MATAVAKKAKAELAIMDENMFAADAGIGVSDLGSEDLAIPFLKVLQKMSDELDDLDGAFSTLNGNPGAPGRALHTVSMAQETRFLKPNAVTTTKTT